MIATSGNFASPPTSLSTSVLGVTPAGGKFTYATVDTVLNKGDLLVVAGVLVLGRDHLDPGAHAADEPDTPRHGAAPTPPQRLPH